MTDASRSARRRLEKPSRSLLRGRRDAPQAASVFRVAARESGARQPVHHPKRLGGCRACSATPQGVYSRSRAPLTRPGKRAGSPHARRTARREHAPPREPSRSTQTSARGAGEVGPGPPHQYERRRRQGGVAADTGRAVCRRRSSSKAAQLRRPGGGRRRARESRRPAGPVEMLVEDRSQPRTRLPGSSAGRYHLQHLRRHASCGFTAVVPLDLSIIRLQKSST